MRERRDIKAPDGYLLGGERVVRQDGSVLFQRGWWELPEGFAEPGEYVWVHCIEGGADTFDEIEVAPPGYTSFFAAALEQKTIRCKRTSRPDAADVFRRPEHRTWARSVRGGAQ